MFCLVIKPTLSESLVSLILGYECEALQQFTILYAGTDNSFKLMINPLDCMPQSNNRYYFILLNHFNIKITLISECNNICLIIKSFIN